MSISILSKDIRMMLWHRHPKARLVQWVFADLVILFLALLFFNVGTGLAGLGATMIIASMFVLANKRYIWEGYKSTYKKPKNKVTRFLSEPTNFAYKANTLVLWPAILFTGLVLIALSLSL